MFKYAMLVAILMGLGLGQAWAAAGPGTKTPDEKRNAAKAEAAKISDSSAKAKKMNQIEKTFQRDTKFVKKNALKDMAASTRGKEGGGWIRANQKERISTIKKNVAEDKALQKAPSKSAVVVPKGNENTRQDPESRTYQYKFVKATPEHPAVKQTQTQAEHKVTTTRSKSSAVRRQSVRGIK